MRKYLSVILLLSCILNVAAQTAESGAQSINQPATQHHLMPVPASVRFNQGRLPITKSFTVATKGHVDDRLRSSVERAVRRLERRTVMEFQRGLVNDLS